MYNHGTTNKERHLNIISKIRARRIYWWPYRDDMKLRHKRKFLVVLLEPIIFRKIIFELF